MTIRKVSAIALMERATKIAGETGFTRQKVFDDLKDAHERHEIEVVVAPPSSASLDFSVHPSKSTQTLAQRAA